MFRPSLAAVGVLAVGLLAACSSTTSGTPSAVRLPTTPVAPTTNSSAPATSAPPTQPSSPVSSTPKTSTHPVPAQPLETKTVTGSDGTVYAVSIWAEQESDNCAAHAYGQVAQYLTTHPCTGIRQLLGTTAINGRAVGFAQNSVGFSGSMQTAYKDAGDFSALVSADGTGNLNDLMREDYRLPAGPDHVPYPDAFKALGQDAGVVVTDVWYLDGATPANAAPLEKMAEALFLQI